MSAKRICISPEIDRRVYFKFRDYCHANRVSVARGLEAVMRGVLERAGTIVDDENMQHSGGRRAAGGRSITLVLDQVLVIYV